MNDFVWPSDLDRAENDELNRVCEYLEEVLDYTNGAEPVAWVTPLAYGQQVTFYKPPKPEGFDDNKAGRTWYCRPLVYGDTQPQSAGVPEFKFDEWWDQKARYIDHRSTKALARAAYKAGFGETYSGTTPQPKSAGVPEEIIKRCEEAIEYASEIRGGCISGVREGQKRVRAILTYSPTPEPKQRGE